MEQLIENVLQWGRDKGIIGSNGKGTLEKQTLKMMEEAAETCFAVGQWDAAVDEDGYIYAYKAIDGIGDIAVTLILLSAMLNVPFKACLELAYNDISKRTGKMVDGVFVKDS